MIISHTGRLKGNRFFKVKQYEKALELYIEGLKESPYDSKTTLNIAQVYIWIEKFIH